MSYSLHNTNPYDKFQNLMEQQKQGHISSTT
jgi:hypothetical protein